MIPAAAQFEAQGAFAPAGVGVGQNLLVRSEVRADRVCWLNPAARAGAIGAYLARLEDLRQALNRDLTLGLFSFEGHLVIYPPGASYRRHLDQFRGVELRTLTAILYISIPTDKAPTAAPCAIYTDPNRPDHYETIALRGFE